MNETSHSRRRIVTILFAVSGALVAPVFAAAAPFRPPAAPLVTSDPYLSIWSAADHLNDRNTTHWTGHEQSLLSVIRVDGKPFRIMGRDPQDAPALPQVSLSVMPITTVYQFEGAGVHVTLTFLTPLLPHDLELMGRPLTYLTWQVNSMDGQTHSVQLLYSTSSELAVDNTAQTVTWGRESAGDLTLLKVGSQQQRRLDNPGDDTRIDWGYAYTGARSDQSTSAIGGMKEVLASFTESGKLPGNDDTRQPRRVSDDQPICAFAFDLGGVSADPVSRQVMIAYDEIESILYFGKPLQPYWRRNGGGAIQLFQKAAADYADLLPRCEQFNRELVGDARRIGGDSYASIVALAYRQAWAGCGFVADSHKQPLLFTKENTSNGDIATVDVIFPMDPIWMLLSPNLAKASLVSNLMYSASPHWKFPNAPHDLGTYPIVSGRDDGGEGMPVEESGNMLILCDAIAQEEGSAEWLRPWWPQLTQWAHYLEKYGLDPENQLCTDDFMGHLAHNANLSIKAILGLAAYGDLCRLRGDATEAARYRDLAKADARHWVKVADAGDHSLLAFDKPDTWSQKYNLVWDRILGLNIFPPEVAAKEIAYYKTRLQRYGLPLDSRTKLTKTDWSLWSATLAAEPADFHVFVDPIVDYLNETISRVPFVDSYETNNVDSSGMHARPVIGGVFIKLLSDKRCWQKWSQGDQQQVGGWAPLPKPPKVVEIVPDARTHAAVWKYTTDAPDGDGWTKPNFDADHWKFGRGGFGTSGTPGAVIGTRWNTSDIWIRRQVRLPESLDPAQAQFVVYHDEDVEIYVDGVLATSERGFNPSYQPLPINDAAKALLKPGASVTIAAHCHQTIGGQDLDIGLANVVPSRE
ncbi:MAG TPA: DUF4965 domain-containing protein [Tepidisphaeraceae bacterium]|nr:DUF4965 domain-containing protein [Tepidisphaeraceae bacterium]